MRHIEEIDMAGEPTETESSAAETSRRESRVAIIGIVLCLVFTAIGLTARSPLFGALGLIVIVVMVVLRKPIARRLPL